MAVAAPTPATPTYYTIIWDNGSNYPNDTPNYMIMATSAAGAAAEVTTKENAGDQASVFGGPYTTLAAAKAAIPGGTPAADITSPVGAIPGVTTPAPAAPKAAAAVVTPTIPQPLFDPRIRTVQNPLGGGAAQFERGFMVWDTSLCTAAGYSATDPPYVNFLFNPSTVQASFELSDSTAQAAMLFGVSGGGGGGVPWVGLQQQMNFTIMFDRTYEVNGTTATQQADLQAMGVEVDVRAVKQFTGMFSQANTAGNASGFYTSSQGTSAGVTTAIPSSQKISQATGTGVGPQQGIMLMMPSYCYFGTSLLGGTSQYYGYVDSWDVQYTHYTAEMVPIRCVVDIEYTLLPQGSNNLAELSNGAVQTLQNQQNLGNTSLPTGPKGVL